MKLTSHVVVGSKPGPHLLITGGVHGDEWEPMQTARRLIRELDPAQLSGKITLVPVVNEAAFARGKRTAEDDLDLARTCPGREDGNTTERIAAALTALIRTADYYIDLHTAGTVFQMLPLAGYCLHTDPQVLAISRRMAQAFNLPIVWGTNARLDGRSLSVARDAKIPAIYVEHGGGGTCDPARVNDCVIGCLGVARELGMLEGVPVAAHAVHYVVEDDRDNSGHLQAQCQASVAGFFQPEVALGDVVAQGQTIGQIWSPLGESLAAIRAYDRGMVLLLRSFPSVQPGDPLVVLLPITEPGTVSFAR